MTQTRETLVYLELVEGGKDIAVRVDPRDAQTLRQRWDAFDDMLAALKAANSALQAEHEALGDDYAAVEAMCEEAIARAEGRDA